MVKAEIKKGNELTPEEIKSLEHLYLLSNPKMPANHIEENHIKKTNPVFYLYKREEKILAYQAYSLFKLQTPFARKKISVIYFNLSYKDPEADKYIKNFAKTSNLTFLRHTFGRFWYFRKFVMVFQTYNPKLVERVSKAMEVHYPHYEQKTPEAVFKFAQQFFKTSLGLPNTIITEDLIKEEVYETPSEITSSWEKMYKSENPKRNEFLFRHRIIIKEDDRFFLSGRALFYIGKYSFWGLFKSKKKNKK